MIFKSFCSLCGIPHFSCFQNLCISISFSQACPLFLWWPCIAPGTGQVEILPFPNVLLDFVDQNTILLTAHLECLT